MWLGTQATHVTVTVAATLRRLSHGAADGSDWRLVPDPQDTLALGNSCPVTWASLFSPLVLLSGRVCLGRQFVL
jgi:hypothetical protein